MSIFDILSLFGGLAMFLYGMRLMSGGLKESSSGTLKKVLEKVTNNPFKAFLLGMLVTAIIQSSTAAIVITSGLVAAGIIKFRQSIGIIIGANVGTTVTGQIIRLLDLNTGGASSWLQVFKPSTLAPAALVAGIVLIMFLKFRNSEKIGGILMGFGILFSGLLTMTQSVSVLSDKGVFDPIFRGLGASPVIGYLSGAGVAFALQSSSATIGILQTFSTTGQLTFSSIYSVIVGVYLGDCVTTAIVCSIGAKADAKRVGVAHVLFNLGQTVLVLLGITVAHALGLLDGLWNATANSGMIANTNTVFNLSCAILLFPFVGVIEKLSCRIVRDDPVKASPYENLLDELNPNFFATPALAFKSCYDCLLAMFRASRRNIDLALGLLFSFDRETADKIAEEEESVDVFADRISSYLVALSPHVSQQDHVLILDNYYKVITEFERLSDHAMNISEVAASLNKNGTSFSEEAKREIAVIQELLDKILDYAGLAFEKRNEEAARHIEPLEEVVDDMVSVMKDRHLDRLKKGKCNVYLDTEFSKLMSDLERISDVCSNVGVATVARIESNMGGMVHSYISNLHGGNDPQFNEEYAKAHDEFFEKLETIGSGE